MEDINKVRIYDAGSVVYDRYTIIFVNRKFNPPYYEALVASRDPYHPQGFGQHISCLLPNKYNRVHLGRRLRLDQLPEKVQVFVKDNYM